jgi:protein-S-isoprenylcysteine O-methyltransferase Ste14
MTTIRDFVRAAVAAIWTRAAAPLASIVFVVLLPVVAFAQKSPTQEQGDSVAGIAAAVVGVIALVGSLVARWTQTPTDLPRYVRLSRVLDATQIVDTTRRLDDE